jgi:hypothetical protein
MMTKSNTLTNTKTLKNAVLLALLLTFGIANAWSATQEEDKAKGEVMLRQARTDITEANRLAVAAANAQLTAQRDQAIANRKRLQAHSLEREAFLLIRDSKRMEAAELRARAESQAQQVTTEAAELQRLQGLLANEKQITADTTSAAGKIRDAANGAAAPDEKTELLKMADALTTQATTAGSEAAVLQQRIAPVQTEVNRLNTSIANLNQAAQRLAPAGP